MTTFVWSDLHVGHVNLAEKWRPEFGGTVPTHNEHLRERWNATVTDNDAVIIVGDSCMGTLTDSLEFMKTFNGWKILVAGNHDRYHPYYIAKHRVKPEKAEQLRAMYAEVFDLAPLNYKLTPDDNIVFSHFPWKGSPDHPGQEERTAINDWGIDPTSTTDVLIHGHTHAYVWDQFPRAVHVGVDTWPDGPVRLDVVRELADRVR